MEDGEIEEGPVTVVDDDQQDHAQSADLRKLEESPYELLQNSKASLESIVAEMLSIKREGKPKSQLRELATQMLLNFVTLRQVHLLFPLSASIPLCILTLHGIMNYIIN